MLQIPAMLRVKIFSTTNSEEIAEDIYKSIGSRLSAEMPGSEVSLGKTEVMRFSNDNLMVKLIDSVRGCYVVVVHTQSPPVNDGLVELFSLLHAIKNASPGDVLLVFPMMPYARSDKKDQPHISIMAALIADIISGPLNIDKVLILDAHSSQINEYFETNHTPAAEGVSAIYLLADFIKRNCMTDISPEDCIVAYADAGSASRYKKIIGNVLRLPQITIDKLREDNSENPTTGELDSREVQGKNVIIFDDEILTGTTIIEDASTVMKAGAKSVIVAAVHLPLSVYNKSTGEIKWGTVLDRLENSPIKMIIGTDSTPVRHKLRPGSKLVILSVAPLLAESIKRVILGQSLGDLHDRENVYLYRD